jgi:hypothetical protein
MRRFRRWLFNALAAVSLLLWVITIIVWVRSEFAYDEFAKLSIDRGTGNYVLPVIVWDDGRLEVLLRTEHFDKPPLGKPPLRDHPWRHIPNNSYSHYPHGAQYNGMSNVKWIWFYHPLLRDAVVQGTSEYWIVVRLWIIAALTSIAPSVWVWQTKREHGRAAQGFCRQCGYDLRATPDRCPECGSIPPKPEEAISG